MISGPRELTKIEKSIIGRNRLAQGAIVATGQVIDARGMIGAPFVALSTLAIMERHGTITATQRLAGERFHDLFRRAALDDLKAAEIDRVRGGGTIEHHNGNERARKAIAAAIRALGGEGAVTASGAWHVLGLEWSIRQWAIIACRGKHLVACGVLVGTLAILDPHFRA